MLNVIWRSKIKYQQKDLKINEVKSGNVVENMIPIIKKSRAEKREDLRNEILEASIELFLEQGYEKTTTRQILQKVSIRNGSLYNIFRNKEDIFNAVMIDALTESMNEAEKYLGEEITPLDRIAFPLCMEIYAASRSVRIAGLLAVSNKKWDIMNSACEMLMQWIVDHDPDREVVKKGNGLKLKMVAFVGALGNVVERFEKEPDSMTASESAHVLFKILVATFNIKAKNIQERVDSILKILSENEIRICGVLI